MKKKKTNQACSDSGIFQQLGYNISKDGTSRCIKAGYFKMGLGNMLYHPNDGYTAPCVLEFTIKDD